MSEKRANATRPLRHRLATFLGFLLLLCSLLQLCPALSAWAEERSDAPPPSAETRNIDAIPPSAEIRNTNASPPSAEARNTDGASPSDAPPLGWYYEDDTGRWFYHLPATGDTASSPDDFSTGPRTAFPSGVSPTEKASIAQSPTAASGAQASRLLKTGWHDDRDGFRYYLDPSDGHMLDGTQMIDGRLYHFLPERNRGNYHQDDSGAWYYRANGLDTYGSLQWTSPSDSPASSPPVDRTCHPFDSALIDAIDLVTERLTIPKKETNRSWTEKKATGSRSEEIPSKDSPSKDSPSKDSPSKETPSDIPKSPESPTPPDPSDPAPDPGEQPDPSPDPKEPSDPSPDPSETPDPPAPTDPDENPDPPSPDPDPSVSRPPHTDDPTIRCIANDDWDTIRTHRDAYADCITNHCIALLYLSGPEITEPLSDIDSSTRQSYPLYVSLIDASENALTFAQAYAIPELSNVPMYIGSALHPSEDGATFRQSNAGGLGATWLYQFLTGTDSYRFYLEDDEGTRTEKQVRYPGYELRIPEAEDEQKEGTEENEETEENAENEKMEENERIDGKQLPLKTSSQYLSRGYQAESADVETELYQRYLSRSSMKESRLSQLEKQNRMLTFPSEQELQEISLEDAQDPDSEAPLSLYLKSEHTYPELAASWRSDESYWLRSTPSAYLSEAQYEALGLEDPATRDEYFLIADADGELRAAHYDDTAAVRLMFRV